MTKGGAAEPSSCQEVLEKPFLREHYKRSKLSKLGNEL